MSLIDTTYFVRDIDIPISSNPILATPLSEAITRYEDDILKSLLGYKLWKEMKDDITASELGALEVGYLALPDKWNKFINGAEFTFEFNGQTITEYWEGLVNTKKVSLLAYFVYFMYRKENTSSYTGLGETVSKAENSVIVSPRQKMILAWNSMVDLYGYGTYFYKYVNNKPSAYNYLLANISDFPYWKFTQINPLNVWGL